MQKAPGTVGRSGPTWKLLSDSGPSPRLSKPQFPLRHSGGVELDSWVAWDPSSLPSLQPEGPCSHQSPGFGSQKGLRAQNPRVPRAPRGSGACVLLLARLCRSCFPEVWRPSSGLSGTGTALGAWPRQRVPGWEVRARPPISEDLGGQSWGWRMPLTPDCRQGRVPGGTGWTSRWPPPIPPQQVCSPWASCRSRTGTTAARASCGCRRPPPAQPCDHGRGALTPGRGPGPLSTLSRASPSFCFNLHPLVGNPGPSQAALP